MTESELQANIRELAKLLGWLTYHTHDSRRSEPGFPDLVLVGHGRMLVRELKDARGRVSDEQRDWLEAFDRAGVDQGVWRPADWLDGTIERELRP